MPDNPLTLETIGGGKLWSDFHAALRLAVTTLDDKDLIGRPRKITINVALIPQDESYVKTDFTVKLALPAKERSGMSMRRTTTGGSDHLVTDSLCVESNQMNIPATIGLHGKVTGINDGPKGG